MNFTPADVVQFRFDFKKLINMLSLLWKKENATGATVT
jgi:hypothetical protein